MAKREEWIEGKKRNFESSIGEIIYATVKPVFKNHSKLEAASYHHYGDAIDELFGSSSCIYAAHLTYYTCPLLLGS